MKRLTENPTLRALALVAILFAISPILAPESLSRTAVMSMLPFAGLTIIVSIGQTLVIQQAGLDLSVAGGITLTAFLVARYGGPDELGLGLGIFLALAVGLGYGLFNGLIISLFRLPPLVVTIATNTLLVGVVQALSGGFGAQSPETLTSFALNRWLGVPVITVIAVVLVVALQIILKLTKYGRRFELVGESSSAARLIGIPTEWYTSSAYVLSGLLAGATGVLLAALLRSPTLTAGNAYLLPSIAAVVLGGTALTGGSGSLTGTALGALFLGQLNQLVKTFTQNTAAQNLVQASIIGVGIVAQLQISRQRTPRLDGDTSEGGGAEQSLKSGLDGRSDPPASTGPGSLDSTPASKTGRKE